MRTLYSLIRSATRKYHILSHLTFYTPVFRKKLVFRKIDFILFNVPLENVSCRHCQWRAAKFGTMYNTYSLWRISFHATFALTWILRGLYFFFFFKRQPHLITSSNKESWGRIWAHLTFFKNNLRSKYWHQCTKKHAIDKKKIKKMLEFLMDNIFIVGG
jgi:hypothetical protein